MIVRKLFHGTPSISRDADYEYKRLIMISDKNSNASYHPPFTPGGNT